MNDSDTLPEISKDVLMPRMHRGYEAFKNYIEKLSKDQLTVPKDAAGWTLKDHLIHIAVWEYGVVALLRGENRLKAMGLTDWDELDVVNAKIKSQNEAMPVDEVLKRVADVHEQMVAVLDTMTNDQLMMPYNKFDPEDDNTRPVIWLVAGDTFQHYEEHMAWMDVILEGYDG